MDLTRNITTDTITDMDIDTEMTTKSKVDNFFFFIKEVELTLTAKMLNTWFVQFKVPGLACLIL